ncbi:MAG: ribosome maturation factor RimM [bacterium]|nr:ribosome maturation factor RimM [bacterium]
MADGPSDSEIFITIGKVLKPRGLDGEAFLHPLTDYPERFQALNEVLLEKPDGTRVTLQVERIRSYGKRMGIQFKGIRKPEAASLLRGSFLLVPPEEVYPLPEDTFYVFEIVGLQVETAAGEVVGKVVDVLSLPGSDVYVVDRNGREVMLPAAKDLVRVDLEGGRVVVQDVEGLLE